VSFLPAATSRGCLGMAWGFGAREPFHGQEACQEVGGSGGEVREKRKQYKIVLGSYMARDRDPRGKV
jgi:hypothetical protein